jgi:hypothetical protein
VEGDEEYWLQNSPERANVSDRSKIIERDKETIRGLQNEDALKENDLSQDYRSRVATDKEFLDNHSAMYSNIDLTKSVNSQIGGKTVKEISKELEHMVGKSADFGSVSVKNEMKGSKHDERID